MMQRGVAGREREAAAEPVGGGHPLLRLEGADAARLVTLGTLEQRVECHHQRIGRQDLVVRPLPQMEVGLRRVAERGVGLTRNFVGGGHN
jgi:hypothetical protein